MHNTILGTFLTIFPSRYHPHHQNKAGKFKEFLKLSAGKTGSTCLWASPPRGTTNKKTINSCGYCQVIYSKSMRVLHLIGFGQVITKSLILRV